MAGRHRPRRGAFAGASQHRHFAPVARNAWRAHALGQTVHVTDGVGLMQARGGEIVEMQPGDTIYTPDGEWHWHDAAPERFHDPSGDLGGARGGRRDRVG